MGRASLVHPLLSATEGLDRLAPEKFRFPSGERGQGQGLYAAERLLGNANTEPNQGCRRLRLPFQPYRAELTKLPREVRVARLRHNHVHDRGVTFLPSPGLARA